MILNQILNLKIALDRANSDNFFSYVKLAWPRIETSKLISKFHVQVLCEHLEAASRGQIDRLAIAYPPGYSKSTVTSILWPTWHWLVCDPKAKLISTSVDPNLTARFSRNSRALLESDWWQLRWGDKFRVADDRDQACSTKEYYIQIPVGGGWERAGMRFATSIGGPNVGWHADIHIGDDLLKPQNRTDQAKSVAKSYWLDTLGSRRRPGSRLIRVLVGQRLAHQDPIAIVKELGTYECLILPIEYEPSRYSLPSTDDLALRQTKLGSYDPRTEPGELIDERLHDSDDVVKLRAEMPDFETQYNQAPSRTTRRVYDRSAFGPLWTHLPDGGQIIWSWDLRSSNEIGDHLSYVVGWCFLLVGQESYFLEERRDQWDFVQTCHQIKTGYRSRRGTVLIENKASGPQAANILGRDIPTIELRNPRGSKLQRAQAAAVYLKHVHFQRGGANLEEIFTELDKFPLEPNDRGDVISQYIDRCYIDEEAQYAHALGAL